MKKSIRYSALIMSVILMLGGCAAAGTEQDQSEGSAVQSSTVQSEPTTQESTELPASLTDLCSISPIQALLST